MATWDRGAAAHLYRRAAFGATPEEIDEAVGIGRQAAVDRLVDYEQTSTADLDALVAAQGFDLGTYHPEEEIRRTQGDELQRWWALRLTYTPRPLEEKMTLFWHGHLTTSGVKVLYPHLLYAQNLTLRSMAMGRFGDLLLALARDPAMLLWLDNASNVRDAPNENFAREAMELFTMGIGHYTQQDVTESARAFTGWTVDPDAAFAFTFDPTRHDFGTKTVLGTTGTLAGEDVCGILAARPETAGFVTSKLARFFLGSDPGADLAQRLAALFLDGGGEIRPIVREILMSDDFAAAADSPGMYKSPTELVVGALRSLGAHEDGTFLTATGLYMGQGLFRPPNVAGWKGGSDWINTGAYMFRTYALLTLLATRDDTWSSDDFFAGQAFQSADDLIDFLAGRLTIGRLSDETRDALREYLRGAGEPLSWTPDAPDRWGRGALHLLMVSPDYQLQ